MASSAAAASREPQASAPLRAWRQSNARLTAWRTVLAEERAKSAPEQAAIAYWTEQIATEEGRLREIESGLAASDPRFYQTINPQTALLEAQVVAAWLPKGTALIEYFFFDEDLLAWAIDKQGLIKVHQTTIDVKALEREIRTLHSRCGEHAGAGRGRRVDRPHAA